MARTFGQMIDEVLHDEFDSGKYRTLVDRWLKEAFGKIAREVQMPKLRGGTSVTLAAGVSSVALPAGVQTVEEVDLSIGSTSLDRLEEVDRLDLPENLQVGRPTRFAFFGLNLWFNTITDRSYDLTVLGDIPQPSPGSEADSVFGLPEEFEDVAIHYARSKAFAMEDDTEMATFHWNAWTMGLREMRRALQTQGRNRVRQIEGMLAGDRSPTFRRP